MNEKLEVFENWPFIVPDFNACEKKLKDYAIAVNNAQSADQVVRIIKSSNKYLDKVTNEITHIEVLFSLETTNDKYSHAMELLNEKLPVFQNGIIEIEKAICNSQFKDELEKKFGSHLFKIYDFSLRSFDEKIIEEMVEENKLTMQYDALIAGCKVPYKGQIYNLSQMGKFMQDTDRNVRKSAAKAYYSYLSTKVDEIEDIYDKLVKVRTEMAHKMGYKDYVELGYLKMSRYDYTKEDVTYYREQIREYVTPLASKLVKDQFKRVGLRKPKIYDLSLSFKSGNPIPKGTTQDKIESAKLMYDKLSNETSYFFRFMADHHVMDLETRAGKQSGGYMTYFPVYKTPFIFSNFNGTAGDVDVLTHEFGHSFQAYMSRNIKVPDYRSPTMETCEIHSMSMEFFAHPYMDMFFDDPDKYKYAHLMDAITFLPYGVTVDEFQEWVYSHPDATKEERDQIWHELELKYTPYKVDCYVDCPYLEKGHRWLTQGHIFGSPFYYIDYTLAQVMAFQFFNLDRKNHKLAWNKYLKVCEAGGKYPFRTLVTTCKLKDPFKPGVIKDTIKPLVKVLKTYDIKGK